jgi:hypothetical protein
MLDLPHYVVFRGGSLPKCNGIAAPSVRYCNRTEFLVDKRRNTTDKYRQDRLRRC